MNKLFSATLMASCLLGFSQDDSSHYAFTSKVMEVEGDLNKDNLPDKVVVEQDTASATAPYRLQIFFREKNGRSKLIASSMKIIAPQYPNGLDGYASGDGFSEVTIKKGVVSVVFGLLRGHSEYKFRFQNGNFELIGFSMVYSDGRGVMATTDFNLSTGIRVEKTERYDTNQVLSNDRKKVWIRPLPKLQDVVPMEGDLY